MAIVTKNTKDSSVQLGSTPWGNLTSLAYNLKTASTGAVIGSDSAAALAIADKVRIGILPAGIKFVDSDAIINDAFTAAVTGSLGFEYVDGVDDPSAPQSVNYFGAGLVLSAAARLRNATTNKPVTLQKEAWLILTTAGAAHNTAADVDILITGVAVGTK